MMISGSITELAAVIARSESDEAIHSVQAARWIASLRSQMTNQPHIIVL
jgi:protease II